MTSLFLKIEETEQIRDDIIDYRDAISELSKHDSATFALTNALMDAVLLHEKQWQEIEHRVDYQTKYTDREQARKDFLREYFSK